MYYNYKDEVTPTGISNEFYRFVQGMNITVIVFI
jgi:hypothetical protein